MCTYTNTPIHTHIPKLLTCKRSEGKQLLLQFFFKISIWHLNSVIALDNAVTESQVDLGSFPLFSLYNIICAHDF